MPGQANSGSDPGEHYFLLAPGLCVAAELQEQFGEEGIDD